MYLEKRKINYIDQVFVFFLNQLGINHDPYCHTGQMTKFLSYKHAITIQVH